MEKNRDDEQLPAENEASWTSDTGSDLRLSEFDQVEGRKARRKYVFPLF